MDNSSTSRRHHRALGFGSVAGALAAGTVAGILVLPHAALAARPGRRAAHSKVTVAEHKVGSYGKVLTTSGGWSLYLLSTESGGKLHCTSSACVASWPPLTVAKGARLSKGSGVRGTLGHVARGSRWQVTYNGWPLYRYAGDSKPDQSNGEKVVAFGGTWYLLKAAATTSAGSPVTSTTSSGGSTTTTTTTSGW